MLALRRAPALEVGEAEAAGTEGSARRSLDGPKRPSTPVPRRRDVALAVFLALAGLSRGGLAVLGSAARGRKGSPATGASARPASGPSRHWSSYASVGPLVYEENDENISNIKCFGGRLATTFAL